MTPAPILVSRGIAPDEAAVPVAIHDLLLAAPLFGGLDPCKPDHTQMYRSLLRGAMAEARRPYHLEDKAAFWEHRELLYGHLFKGKEVPQATPLFSDRRDRGLMIDKFLTTDSKKDADVCRGGNRFKFVAPDESEGGYYKAAIETLRKALEADPMDSGKASQAAACLREALRKAKESQNGPRCDVKGQGLFLVEYAPFLPLAILTEKHTRDRGK
jgi:hypothetical protein